MQIKTMRDKTMHSCKNVYFRSMTALLLVVACLLPARALFALEPVVLADGVEDYAIGRHLEILEDKERRLTLADIESGTNLPWKKSDTDSPGYGVALSSAFWVRFRVQDRRTAPEKWLLSTTHTIMEELAIYHRDRDGKLFRVNTGGRHRLKERPVPDRTFILPLPAKTEGGNYIYVRLNAGIGVVSMPFRIMTEKTRQAIVYNEQIRYGLFFGFLIIMVVYNFLLFLLLRSMSYLLYVLYIATMIIYQADVLGFTQEYLWIDSPQWNYKLTYLFVFSWLFFGIAFFRRFLETARNTPRLDAGLKLGMAFAVVGGLSVFFNPLLVAKLFLYAGTAISLYSILVAVVCAFQGYRPARFLLAGWLALVGGIVVFNLRNAGLLPDVFLTVEAMRIGTALEVMLFSIALGDRYNLMRQEKEAAEREKLESRMRMLEAAARFVPRQFLNFLGRNSLEEVRLGDSVKKNMAILFSDIRDFTSLSEGMTPEDNFKFMNAYLKRMEPFVHKHGGFIDKYIGDAIMALFPGGARDAVLAAVEMQQKLAEYNRERESYGYKPIRAGIGIHSGDLMLGTIGGESRMDSTVISDAVNLAARLEGLTKLYGCYTLVSESSLNEIEAGAGSRTGNAGRAGNFGSEAGAGRAGNDAGGANEPRIETRRLGLVQVKGKREPVNVYEVLDAEPQDERAAKLAARVDFERALGLYQAGKFKEALAVFASIAAARVNSSASDSAAKLYARRCEAYAALDASPPGWDGVEVMEAK